MKSYFKKTGKVLSFFLTSGDLHIIEEINDILKLEAEEILEEYLENTNNDIIFEEDYVIKNYKFKYEHGQSECYIEFEDGSDITIPIELRDEKDKEEIELLWCTEYWDGPISGYCFYKDKIHYFTQIHSNDLEDKNLLLLNQASHRYRYYDIFELSDTCIDIAVGLREYIGNKRNIKYNKFPNKNVQLCYNKHIKNLLSMLEVDFSEIREFISDHDVLQIGDILDFCDEEMEQVTSCSIFDLT